MRACTGCIILTQVGMWIFLYMCILERMPDLSYHYIRNAWEFTPFEFRSDNLYGTCNHLLHYHLSHS